MEKITSLQNARIKKCIRLLGKASERRAQGAFLVEGLRLFMDTPAVYLLEIFMTEAFYEAHAEEEAFAEKLDADAEVFIVTEEILKKISDTQNPQGIVCTVRIPVYDEAYWAGLLNTDIRNGIFLILENIQDPGNLGTLFRSAEAAGAAGIIMTRGCVDLFSPKVVRSTMSAVFRMPYMICESLSEQQDAVVTRLRNAGITVLAAALDASACGYWSADYTGPCAVMIGNEGNGLSREAIDAADRKVFIPMQGRIESLNAAVAGSVILFEAARQRDHNAHII